MNLLETLRIVNKENITANQSELYKKHRQFVKTLYATGLQKN